MFDINIERVEKILNDRIELAPKINDTQTFISVQLYNEEGPLMSVPINLWYAFTLEMRNAINRESKPTPRDAIITKMISDVHWLEYTARDEDGTLHVYMPTWSF